MASLTDVEPAPSGADGDRSSPDLAGSRFRRACTLRGALAVTALGALLPGAGLVWTGRRLGWLLVLPSIAAMVLTGLFLSDVEAMVELALDPGRLRPAAAVAGAVFLLWAVVVVTTYILVRPRDLSPARKVLGGVLVIVLCGLVAAPVALGARYAITQADLVSTLFEGNTSATAPRDVTPVDPWGGRHRVSILMLGSDASPTRDGVRTDTVVLLTINTRTGRSTMFSLPRNMMNAQFPEGSPLHDLYPEGFRGDGDDAAYMLNAVYGQVPALHPGALGRSRNEGADAIKQAVAGSLGTRVDYYVLVDLQGFQRLVDAVGGVRVNINEPVPIGGDTDLGIPPEDYLQPGPDQQLDGFHAMWFSRGRYGSTDYQRMLRQRCMLDALIAKAEPLNLIRRYERLAAAGKRTVQTDIPRDLLPAFVDLAGKVKDRKIRSVAFVSSPEFFSGDPDFEWMRSVVDRALEPPRARREGVPEDPPADDSTQEDEGEEDPGAAVDVVDQCGYQPEE